MDTNLNVSMSRKRQAYLGVGSLILASMVKQRSTLGKLAAGALAAESIYRGAKGESLFGSLRGRVDHLADRAMKMRRREPDRIGSSRREVNNARIDEAVEESFPASDPPSYSSPSAV